MKKKQKEHRVRTKELEKHKTEMLEKFCYLKVKVEELDAEKTRIQAEILAWPDRPDKTGIEVPPYGTLKLGTRSNWFVLDVPAVFKKIGKDTFLEICSVATGKLKKVVGTIGFSKLEKLGIIKQDKDSEFYTLKKSPAMNGALKKK